MQLLYNSDNFAVVQFEPRTAAIDDGPPAGGGYEIVDKFARKDIYLHGALAERFKLGVQALVDAGPTEEALDEFIAGFTTLAQHPLVLH